MLKSQEHSNCHEPLSQEWMSGDTEPSSKTLDKTKLTKSSILNHGVGLDPVAISYLIARIKRTHSIPD